MLRTSVKVFGPTALDDYDSGITYPVHLHKLGSCGPRRELAYCYRLGCKPGFDVWWPSSAAPSPPSSEGGFLARERLTANGNAEFFD
jgi:hypothetical protein